LRAKKRKVLTEVTLVRHVRSTNRNFYYYHSLIYFRSPERAAAGFRLNYRELVIKPTLSSSFSLPIEDYRWKIRTPKYDPSVIPEVLVTKYSFNTNFLLLLIRTDILKIYLLSMSIFLIFYILNIILIFYNVIYKYQTVNFMFHAAPNSYNKQ